MYAVDPATLMGVFVVIDSMVPNEERHAHHIPGIAHPATKGWLLHILREARGDGLFVGTQECDDGTWEVSRWMGGPIGTGPTEGEALAAALLAVWGTAA